MDLLHHLVVALIFLAGSLLQGAVGFAFNLLTIPLLVKTGLHLSEVVALITLPVTAQVLLATLRLRRFVQWREVSVATLLRLSALPVGIALLLFVDGLAQAQLERVLGTVVLAALALQLAVRAPAGQPLRRRWRVLAFAGSGLMQGVSAMGGPPAVLWVMAQPWSSQQSRGFLQALFLLSAPVQLALLVFAKGPAILAPMLTGLVYLPVVAVGTLAGVWLGNRLNKATLRVLALGILAFTALSSLLGPLL